MKKLLFFAFVALGMLACTEQNTPSNEDVNQGGSTNQKEISCDPTLIEFDISQDYSQVVTLTASSEWSATTNADWISIEPLSGQGDAFVKLSMKGGKISEGKVIFSTGKASAQVIVKCIDKYEGSFSVSSTKKVFFSKGNLQYQASTQTWRFAEHQYDIIGDANKNISSSYGDWIDLFGWGTSGYQGLYPYSSSIYSSTYNNNKNDIAGTNYDWGVYDIISNGENQAGLWRTLTKEEWLYVLKRRTNASSLFGLAKVNGTCGYVLLPDGWKVPEGITWNGGWSYYYSNNQYSSSQWAKMEKAGAIFLPTCGIRIGTNWKESDSFYWSSSFDRENADSSSAAIEHSYFTAWCVYVQNLSDSFSINATRCCNGCAVRLVKDVE